MRPTSDIDVLDADPDMPDPDVELAGVDDVVVVVADVEDIAAGAPLSELAGAAAVDVAPVAPDGVTEADASLRNMLSTK